MPVVTFQAGAIRRILGKSMPTDEIAEVLPQVGGELGARDGESLTLEWFPNRPDLLTVEGSAVALRAFAGIRLGLPKYPVQKGKFELKVDATVAQVRPFAGLAIVRGVPFDADLVQAAIDAQEKLALGPGRRRKRVAIGLHDAKGLEGPFTYTALGPNDRPFVPLGTSTPMTPAQVVAQHPKGKEYGHLVDGKRFPAFLDAKGQVLSLPPIINSQRTAVTAATRDVLVDVTGTEARPVRQTIALLCMALAERGGTIESVTVHDASGTWTCPDLRPVESVVHLDDSEALLGLKLSADDACKALRRMGHDAEPYGNKVHVHSPAWRFDLLHAVDLIEDIAIGAGFDAFPDHLPTVQTFGGRLATHRTEARLRSLLTGHGWHEAKTLTLSDPASQWLRWGAPAMPAVQLKNPVLEEQTLLRRRILPGLLQVLAANRHRSLPQRLFEVGHVIAPDEQAAWRNTGQAAGAILDAKAGLADIQGVVEALLRDLAVKARIEPGHRPGYIPGRQGRVIVEGKEAGHFGELHPDTILAFGLTAPCAAFELDSDLLGPSTTH